MVANDLLSTTVPAPQLLERDAEIGALTAVLAAARGGDGRLVVVEGGAGIGKTRLLGEAREIARAGDFEVLSARGGELEGEFAFGIVRQMFEAPLAAASAERRAELFAGAAGLSESLFASAPTTASRDGAESSFAMLHGLYWLAANLALKKPTLLVVDDLHWADEPSLRWLVYLAHRLDGLPLQLMVGSRPAEQATTPPLVMELLADPAALVIRPRPLGQESAASLARERLAAEPDPAFADALQTGSGGNPLFLVALLDALWRDGTAPTAEHATHVLQLGPRAIARGVASRLARLPRDAAELLRAAAIVGDQAALPLAAALAGIDTATALGAAAVLVNADLLLHENPLEFTHPVVRTAVLEGMTAGARVAAHRQAAEALINAGASPEQAAGHLVQTLPDHDPFVITTLRRAADRSLSQGAPEAAVAYLRRALDEPPDRTERAEILCELGLAEMHTDAIAAAEHLHRAIAELDDPKLRTVAVVAYAHALNMFGRRVVESAELLQRTSERLGNDEPDMRDRIDALLMITCRYEAELYPIASTQWAKRREQPNQDGLGNGLLLVVASLEEALQCGSLERSLDFGRRALDSDVLHCPDRMYLTSSLAAMAMAGKVDEALAGLAKVITTAQRSGDRLSVSAHQLWRALVHYESGELLLAEEDLILEPTPFWQASTPLAYRAGFLTQVLIERGEIVEAEKLVSGIALDDVQDAHRIQFLYARGRLRLASDRVEESLVDFLSAGALAESLHFRNPAFVPWRSQAALVAHRLDRMDEARALAVEELELSRAWGAARTVGVSLRALGLIEGGEAGLGLLREAVTVLANSPARLEHARALVDLGAALRRDNSRSQARQVLREGIEHAHRCGATTLIQRANDELAATGAHPRTMLLTGAAALTASERRVAHMAARDLSNKEIAQALFVTVKTVEQHLGRVYRKLDVPSRRQLGAALDIREESSEH